MVALNLDPAEMARSEPALFRGFQRLCTSCQSPMRCARDLAHELARDPSEPASSDWRDYCPNATTLNMLSTLQSCSPLSEARISPQTWLETTVDYLKFSRRPLVPNCYERVTAI